MTADTHNVVYGSNESNNTAVFNRPDLILPGGGGAEVGPRRVATNERRRPMRPSSLMPGLLCLAVLAAAGCGSEGPRTAATATVPMAPATTATPTVPVAPATTATTQATTRSLTFSGGGLRVVRAWTTTKSVEEMSAVLNPDGSVWFEMPDTFAQPAENGALLLVRLGVGHRPEPKRAALTLTSADGKRYVPAKSPDCCGGYDVAIGSYRRAGGFRVVFVAYDVPRDWLSRPHIQVGADSAARLTASHCAAPKALVFGARGRSGARKAERCTHA